MAKAKPKARINNGRGSGSQKSRTTGGHRYPTHGALAMDMGYASQPAPRKQRRPRKKIVFVMSAKVKNLGLSSYAVIGVIFACLLAVAVAGANVTIQRQENAHAVNQLRSIEVQNTRLQNQITQARNLDEIEHIARTRLGMSEPLPHQVHGVTLIPSVEVQAVFSAPVEPSVYYTSEWAGFFASMRDFLFNNR